MREGHMGRDEMGMFLRGRKIIITLGNTLMK